MLCNELVAGLAQVTPVDEQRRGVIRERVREIDEARVSGNDRIGADRRVGVVEEGFDVLQRTRNLQFLGASTGIDVDERMFAVTGKVDLYWGGGRSIFQNLITQARVFWMYIGLLFFPKDLAVDRFVTVSTSILETAVIASILGIAVVVFLLLALAFKIMHSNLPAQAK